MPISGRKNRRLCGGRKYNVCGQEGDRKEESSESGRGSEGGRGTNRDPVLRMVQTRRFQLRTGRYLARLMAAQKVSAQYFGPMARTRWCHTSMAIRRRTDH